MFDRGSALTDWLSMSLLKPTRYPFRLNLNPQFQLVQPTSPQFSRQMTILNTWFQDTSKDGGCN
jgi:hypothetical protein